MAQADPVSTFTCPNGHASTASDYCDTCGVPIPAGAAAGRRAAGAAVPRPRPARARRRRRPRAAPPRRAPDAVPQLRLSPRRRGAVLRGLRLRLHHRHAAAPARPLDRRGCRRRRRPAAGPGAAGPGHRRRLGGRGLGRPRLVRGPGERRPLPVAGAPGRRRARRQERARRPPVDQPQHPPGDRLHRRPGGEPAPGAADHRRPALVGRGPPVVQRHLRRARRAGPCRPTRCRPASAASSPRTTGSTSAPGPGSSCAAPPRRNAPTNPARHNFLARCQNLHLRTTSVPVRR